MYYVSLVHVYLFNLRCMYKRLGKTAPKCRFASITCHISNKSTSLVPRTIDRIPLGAFTKFERYLKTNALRSSILTYCDVRFVVACPPARFLFRFKKI